MQDYGDSDFRNKVVSVGFEKCFLGNNMLKCFPNLKYGFIDKCKVLMDKMFEEAGFESLTLRNVKYRGNLNSIANCTKLKNLEIEYTKIKDNLAFLSLSKDSKLEKLCLNHAGNINARFLLNLKESLKELDLRGCNAKDLEEVRKLKLNSYVPPNMLDRNAGVELAKIHRCFKLFNLLTEKAETPIISHDKLYKRAVENSKRYSKDEIVDRNGNSFRWPF
jgi:hypothetical protein